MQSRIEEMSKLAYISTHSYNKAVIENNQKQKPKIDQLKQQLIKIIENNVEPQIEEKSVRRNKNWFVRSFLYFTSPLLSDADIRIAMTLGRVIRSNDDVYGLLHNINNLLFSEFVKANLSIPYSMSNQIVNALLKSLGYTSDQIASLECAGIPVYNGGIGSGPMPSQYHGYNMKKACLDRCIAELSPAKHEAGVLSSAQSNFALFAKSTSKHSKQESESCYNFHNRL